MHLVTRDFIMAGASEGGGWNRAQLAIIGVSWPLLAGWMGRAIGQRITDEAAEDFIALKGNAGKVRPRKSGVPELRKTS